jgi:ComF family protein
MENTRDYAVFDYGNPCVRQAIWQFKYHHNASAMQCLIPYAVPYVVSFIAEQVQSHTPHTITLVPVPQHKHKTYTRGYNQSALIATWLAEILPYATVSMVLHKIHATLPQARTKHRTERMKNVARSMRATQSFDKRMLYIIVDDVTTTGATLNEARRALMQSGGKKILSVSIAHGYLSS